MNRGTVTLNLWFVRETADALRYCRKRSAAEAGPDEYENSSYIWLPRSVCTHRTKFPQEAGGGYPLHIVTVLVWFANKKGLRP